MRKGKSRALACGERSKWRMAFKPEKQSTAGRAQRERGSESEWKGKKVWRVGAGGMGEVREQRREAEGESNPCKTCWFFLSSLC